MYAHTEMRLTRRLLGVVLIAVLLLGVAVPAHAGVAGDVALGLAAFAVFNQLVFAAHAYTYPPAYAYPSAAYPVYAYPTGVYASAPVVYTSPRVVTSPPVVVASPSAPAVVRYPHGRWELRGDGVGVAYQWVWIPAPLPPPPPPAGEPPAPPPSAR